MKESFFKSFQWWNLFSMYYTVVLLSYSKSYQTLVNMFWSDLMIFKKKSSLCWVCIIHYYYLKYPIFSVQLEGRDIIMAALTALCMLCQHLIMKVEAWMCMSVFCQKPNEVSCWDWQLWSIQLIRRCWSTYTYWIIISYSQY